MATINKVDTTFSAQDIHTAASVYEYTADGTYKVRIQAQFTSLAGGGDYSVWLTLNDGDAVADNPIEPITKITLTAGAKSRWFQSGEIDVLNGDVINLFALGLAGDTSVAGIIRVFSDDMTGVTGATLSSGTGTGQVSLSSGAVILQADQAVNATKIGGTSQTGRDLGASVLLSSGTGTGQLDFTSGVVKANLSQILGTALTETSGQIAAAFKKFFDKGTPTGTINSLPDAVAGANGGLPTTNGTKVSQTVDLTAGQSIAVSGGTVTTLTNAPTDMALNSTVAKDATVSKPGTAQTITAPADMALESTLTAIKGAGWSTETLAALAAAILNLDGDVADVFDDVGDVKAELDLVHAKTDNLPADPADQSAVEAAITAGIATIPAGITADDVLDEVITGTYTMRQLLKAFAAKLHGTATGGETTTVTYNGVDGTEGVIVETVDDVGNRSVVTLTV